MKNLKKTLIAVSVLLITGCASVIIVPINSTLISKEKATIIAYSSDTYLMGHRLPLTIDNTIVGEVTAEVPLKIEVQSGEHKMYVGEASLGFIRVVSTHIFEAGKVYFFRTWFEHHPFRILQKLDQTKKIDSYKTFI